MTKQWFLICPSGHRVVEPVAEVHDTPDGILVALTCSETSCTGTVFSFPAIAINWAEAKAEHQV